MANRRPVPGQEFKADAGLDTNQSQDGPTGDDWGNPPSGYQPGGDYGFGGAGGAAESPRERGAIQQAGVSAGGNEPGHGGPEAMMHPGGAAAPITSTPRQPMSPTPAPNGTTFEAGPPQAGPPGMGLQPFQPMSGPTPTDMVSSRLRPLYGASGGLQGGGLGVPGSPSAATNDPISALIQQLLSKSGA